MEQGREQLSLQDVEVGLDVLIAVLKRKGIPLPSEIGAFIALEACEQILDAPVRVRDAELVIGEIGEIAVLPSSERASEADAVRSILLLLGDLLVCSAPGVPEMLLELVEHGASDSTLERLRDELEACLLPLNRGATRRVLARLLREARKEGERSSTRAVQQPDSSALDAELDLLLGGPDVAAPARPTPIPSLRDAHSVVKASVPVPPAPPSGGRRSDAAARAAALLDDDEAEPSPSSADTVGRRGHGALTTYAADGGGRDPAGTAKLSSPVPPAEPPPSAASAREQVEASAAPRSSGRAAERGPAPRTEQLLEEEIAAPGISGGAVLGGLLVLVALVLATAYLLLGQQGARQLLGLPPSGAAQSAAAVAGPAPATVDLRVGELHVSSKPARAQVFLLIGNGPALATDLPVGVAHEFVALAEGHAPARAVVPSNAIWEPVSGQPRYELAMQTGKEATKVEELELGASLLPQDVGTPTGALGSVRVITTPPGSKVYQLIGFTPDVRVENLPLAREYDLLLYIRGREFVERQLTAADFRETEGKRVAEIELRLPARQAH
ncbi:MAG TPA: hypothetical protein VF331_08900 [Polyangiales bacterium]